MIKKLINPFYFLAGFKALKIGLLAIITTAIIAYYTNTNFPDIISVKTGSHLSLLHSITQDIVNWLVMSILLYVAALLFSSSKVRFLDILGTQALARFPYIIASLLGCSKALKRFSDFLLWQYLEQGEPIEITSTESLLAIITLVALILLTIWLITLMFNAFKVSANLKGNKLIAIFIVMLIVATISSGYINHIILINSFSS